MGDQYSVLSDQFASRLNQLSDTDTIEVMISGLEQNTDPHLPTGERRQLAARLNRESLVPIIEYLDANEVTRYSKLEAFGMVGATLTRDQVYGLAQQPYVLSIFENQLGSIELL